MPEIVKKIGDIVSARKKTILAAFLFFFLAAGLFVFGDSVSAGGAALDKIGNGIGVALSWVLGLIISALGLALSGLMWVLSWLLQYKDFINSDAVVYGWVIIRDICNMFFILILLVIAFSVILRIDNYDIKKSLPKLIIMAVLINFSRMICGVIIDASQLIMGVFVNSFKAVTGANLTRMMGLTEILNISADTGTTVSAATVFGAYLLALIYVIIAIIVVCVLIAVVAMRIVMLWVYIVLSPLAYFCSSFPQGKKYASQWWDEFIKQVTIGPILAFFLWLSFVTLGGDKGGTSVINVDSQKNLTDSASVSAVSGNDPGKVGLTKAVDADVLIKFIISIGMLLGGLMVAQQSGGAAGKMAGAGMGKIMAGANLAKRGALGLGKKAAVGAALGGGALALGAAKGLDRSLGVMPGISGTKFGKMVAERGLVGGTAAAAWRMPGKAVGGIRDRIGRNFDLNTNRRRALDDKDRIMKHDDKDWKADEKGVYKQWDKKKKEFVKNEKGEEISLKTKNFFGKETEVREMGQSRARTHDAVRRVGGEARFKRFEAENKGIEEEKKRMASLSEDQLHADLSSATTTTKRKRAAAEMLGEKGKFKDLAEIEKARKSFGGNSDALDKFNDKVDEKQAHKAYDFTKEDDRKKFSKRVSKGKIDLGKIDRDALEKEEVVRAINEHAGDQAPEVYKKIMTRSTSAEDKSKALEAMRVSGRIQINDGKKHGQDAAEHEKAANKLWERASAGEEMSEEEQKAFDEHTTKAKELRAKEKSAKANGASMSRNYAKETGKLKEAASVDVNKTDNNKFDVNLEVAADLFKRGKPNDFEEVKAADVDDLIAGYAGQFPPSESGARRQEMETTIAKSLDVSKLKKLAKKDGIDEDMVRKLCKIYEGLGPEIHDALMSQSEIRALFEGVAKNAGNEGLRGETADDNDRSTDEEF